MKKGKIRKIKLFGKTAEFDLRTAWHDFFAGACMGIAFIIPGFSGGSVAAVLGIYEKMIDAIARLFKDMLRSIVTLIPIALGLVVGAVSLLFPLGYALEAFPLPTVSLFVGLAIGSMPSITEKIKGKPSLSNITALIIPIIVTLVICFLPMGADVDLFGLSFGGYILLVLIGLLGSAALVVPGISGSMLLLVIGYYNPIVQLITDHLFKFDNLRTCILVLISFGIGIAAGFILISMLISYLFKRCPRGTYFSIVGFIIGSLPAVYIATLKDSGMLSSSMEILSLPSSPWHWIACVLLLAIGVIASYMFVRYGRLRSAENKEIEETVE